MKHKFRKYIICNSSSAITKAYVGRRVAVHNGKLYQNFSIKKAMIGYKFGEFITTTKLGPTIHQAKRKKKIKK